MRSGSIWPNARTTGPGEVCGSGLAFVLLFEFLESLGLLSLHAAVLVAPTLEGRLADPQGLADLADRSASRQHPIRVAQLRDDLRRTVSRPLHRESSWPSWPSDSHSTWTSFWGADQHESDLLDEFLL